MREVFFLIPYASQYFQLPMLLTCIPLCVCVCVCVCVCACVCVCVCVQDVLYPSSEEGAQDPPRHADPGSQEQVPQEGPHTADGDQRPPPLRTPRELREGLGTRNGTEAGHQHGHKEEVPPPQKAAQGTQVCLRAGLTVRTEREV